MPFTPLPLLTSNRAMRKATGVPASGGSAGVGVIAIGTGVAVVPAEAIAAVAAIGAAAMGAAVAGADTGTARASATAFAPSATAGSGCACLTVSLAGVLPPCAMALRRLARAMALPGSCATATFSCAAASCGRPSTSSR
jgi:hypothetical protein